MAFLSIRYSLILFFYLVSVSSCSFKLAEYLKPKGDDPIVYNCSFIKPKDSVYRRLESLFGSVGSGDTIYEQTIVVYESIKINGQDVYYAINAKDKSEKDPRVGPVHFLFLAMLFRGDSILLAPVYKKSDLTYLQLEDFNTVLPPQVTKKDTLIVIDKTLPKADKQLLLYGFKKESISINQKRLKHCLRISLMHRYPEITHYGKVWLHKDYGVVKWVRTTGRIEEREFKDGLQ